MNPQNYKHVETTCPECHHTDILMDPEHDVIYCTHCGLVLHENTIFKITQELDKVTYQVHYIRSLWKKDHKQPIKKEK